MGPNRPGQRPFFPYILPGELRHTASTTALILMSKMRSAVYYCNFGRNPA